jgi:hypothetical protein
MSRLGVISLLFLVAAALAQAAKTEREAIKLEIGVKV